jgi:Uma2 family endonuclease
MLPLTLELLTSKEQTEFNLKRWSELIEDGELARNLAHMEGRIETDRYGNVVLMSPPPGVPHGSYQMKIGHLLQTRLPNGRCISECPISTADGVKAADVAWISHARLTSIGKKVCLTKAPEICVEVLSPGNTLREMSEKRALYFAAGAKEVWFCDQDGGMTFFISPASKGKAASKICRDFPQQIELSA